MISLARASSLKETLGTLAYPGLCRVKRFGFGVGVDTAGDGVDIGESSSFKSPRRSGVDMA